VEVILSKRQVSLRELACDFATDAAMDGEIDAAPVRDGYGFIEYPVGKAMRDAMIMQLCRGVFQIQRLVIACETLHPRRVDGAAVAA
jgi:acyl-CoA dehydrogenase